MNKIKRKTKRSSLRNVLLAILPGLIVGGLIFGANMYYDLDTSTIMMEQATTITTPSDKAITLTAGTAGIDADTTGQINLDSSQAAATAVVINASNAAGGIDIDAGTGGIDIDVTGTVAGNAITIDTSDGGIALTALGAANGDITFTAADNYTVDVAGNISIDSDGSITMGGAGISLTSDGANDVVISAVGAAIDLDSATLDALMSAGISLDASTASNFTVTGATQDLTLSSVGGSVGISASEVVADAIKINASGSGAATTLHLTSAGTGASAIDIDSSGGVDIDAAGDIVLDSDTGNWYFKDGGAGILTLSGGALYPAVNEGLDLGVDASTRWEDLFVKEAHIGSTIDITASKIDASGALTIEFEDGSAFTLENSAAFKHLEIDASGKLTLASDASQDILIDSASGKIYLGAGNQILTSADGAASRLSGEEILREMIPIFGFDLPARTDMTAYDHNKPVSREIEDYPFTTSTATAGTTRVYKFIIRYADSVTSGVSTWQVWNVTDSAQTDEFTVPFSASTSLDKGEVYITPITGTTPNFVGASIPTDTDDWQLEVKVASGSIQIYQIFLAAYDVVK